MITTYRANLQLDTEFGDRASCSYCAETTGCSLWYLADLSLFYLL